jgi:DNA polymerase III, epsilon subunit and related 3''-5'' exonucleases
MFADVETTGRDPKLHAIHQFGALLEIDGQVVEKIDIRMRPDHPTTIDLEALKVSGVTTDQICMYKFSSIDGAFELARILTPYFKADERAHLVGWNNRKFDDEFIRAWLGNSYHGWFWSDSIDVMVLASNAICREGVRPTLPNFKLATVAAHYGIEPKGDWHDAMTDVDVTREIYRFLNGERKRVPSRIRIKDFPSNTKEWYSNKSGCVFDVTSFDERGYWVDDDGDISPVYEPDAEVVEWK